MNENIVQEFSCEQCGKVFAGPTIKFDNKEDFDYHLSLHKKVEKTKESANFCQVEPQVKIINTSLELSVFDASANVKCNICGKKFLNTEYLNSHLTSVHYPNKIELQKIEPQKTEQRNIEPPVKRIKTSDASSHVRSAHERKKPHEGKKPHMKDKNNQYKAPTHLQNSANLVKVSSNHTKESSNLCQIEPPEKRINTSLKPPVSDTIFYCNICGDSFSNKESLSSHVRSVHEPQKIDAQKTEPQNIEPPVKRIKPSLKLCDCEVCPHVRSAQERKKPHKCYVCGIRYSLKDTLLTHFKNTLHDKRSINCKYCSRNFTQKEMEIHVPNVHEGEKPYMCNICEKRFWKKTQLNRHLTLKHEEQSK